MSELTTFVHDALAAGKTRPEIQEALKAAGWRPDEVEKALDGFADMAFSVPVPRRKPALSAFDAFQHLVAFVTLFISAFALGGLLFQFVNLLLPDPLRREDWYHHEMMSGLRFAAASLIIAFPVYVLMTRTLMNAYEHDTERRASPIRRWLTYLTLFVAAWMVIGYLIALVASLLGGELALPFTLKVVIVIAEAGAVFGFYMPGLRRDERPGYHELAFHP